MLEIDGSEGEGGGQVLRSALSLCIIRQQPFRIVNIRARRNPPGLKRQHLMAVEAAARICAAQVTGSSLGSRELTFRPGTLRPGDYAFDIGTAGSCSLVLQTVLMPLLTAPGESRVRIRGGTHNKGAPPFEFLIRAFAPLVSRMGARIGLTLHRFGFYPRGGGEIEAVIGGSTRWEQFELHQRGAAQSASADAYVAALPPHVGQRELETVAKLLRWTPDKLHLRALPNDLGPGNALVITTNYEQVSEVFTGFGERGVRAEEVAGAAAREAQAYLTTDAPVGEHLADQLLLPLAVGAGGSFTATTASEHLRTNARVIERFTGRRTEVESVAGGVRITVS